MKNQEKRKFTMPEGLTRDEQRAVREIVRNAQKNDGIPRTAQQSIPFDRMFPDGICRVGLDYYTNTVFDPNVKFNKYKNCQTVMTISEDSLIKPEDLKYHIGEVLMFYSPYGDVVSAILTDVEYIETNPYMYQTKFNFIYTHGLNVFK